MNNLAKNTCPFMENKKGAYLDMILFTILLLILLILIIITVLLVSIGGSAFIIVFGDVIVCIFIIAWILKKLITRK